jgi:protein-tyrosine phosphatase
MLPKHFRKSTDKIDNDTKISNLYGLAELNMSGSSQFSENSLVFLKQSIGNNMPIIVVDLRQESHGFVNGIAVSWFGYKNKANEGLSKEDVLYDENIKLQSIPLGKPLTIDDEILIPVKVQNEAELVESQDMIYVRIPITDNGIPTNDMVDYFVQFVNSLPPNTWIHFHCKAGIGRTTTFMVMYDIMKNSKKVSLEDIVNRQFLLGGKNLLKYEHHHKNHITSRSEFIKKFYEYSIQNNDNFTTTWSQWLKTNDTF